MRNLLRLLVALLSFGSAYGGEPEAKKLSAQLPIVFWYTAELWGELERGSNTGESSNAFSAQLKTKFIKLDGQDDSQELWKFHLYYQEDEGNEEEEGWIFVFRYDGKEWSEVSGVRKTGGSSFQLLKADFFTPSMRPQIKQALELHNSGKLTEKITELER